MGKKNIGHRPPVPPALAEMPLIHASADVARWLDHYWRKLGIPRDVSHRLAVTDDRQEFARWTGRRLNLLALGCYCFLPNASGESVEIGCGDETALLSVEAAAPRADSSTVRLQPTLPGFAAPAPDPASQSPAPAQAGDHRHLIFIEPDLLPVSIEVTVAHELIHLRDRTQGHPRKHRCHGYDAISVDEAALTGRDPEFLRAQLRDETARREDALRRVRPYRYIYVCPVCQREYPRVRRYTRPVSCGRCDQRYNREFTLELRELVGASVVTKPTGALSRLTDTDAETLEELTAWGEARQSANVAAHRGEA
jgi:predicted SprT family Zn-dependent metalloprotease